jgi:hypothetical protein
LTSRGLFPKNSSWQANSQFRMPLWLFTATAWKCAKTSLWTLRTKELAVASQQRTVSLFLLNQGIFYQTQHDCHPHPCDFSVSPIEDKIERPTFWQLVWSRQTQATPEDPHRTRLSECIWKKKMAEALGTVHTRGRGLLRGWWWPVGGSTSPGNYGWLFVIFLEEFVQKPQRRTFSLSFWLRWNVVWISYPLPVRVTFSTHLILLRLITLIIHCAYCAEYKLRSCCVILAGLLGLLSLSQGSDINILITSFSRPY